MESSGKMKQFRNEWKYQCTNRDMLSWRAKLSALMDLDEHINDTGKYRIRSLYFDDIYDSCAKDNEAGVAKRHKYRIRYYNSNLSFIRLEKKVKINGRCFKAGCSISEEEYKKIYDGNVEDLLWENDRPMLQQFCIEYLSKGLRPKAIIDYEREAFVEPNTNIRITFDENITVSDELDEFLSGEYLRIPLQDKDRAVLEVKFDSILPGYIRHAITDTVMMQTSFSKYYLGRKQLQRKV